MKGIAIVTGGNRGIGAAIAESMARRGYEVNIMCRSEESAEAFIAAAGEKGLGNIRFIKGDMGSIAAAKEAAGRVKRDFPKLSVFIHNAGMWPVKPVLNEDGLEQSFVTNHLAPFIINSVLEDIFSANRTRIVQVSAGLYIAGMKDYEAAATGENFSPMRTYATTKLFNLISTMMFAVRWKDRGMTINAVHPGVVRTGLGEMNGVGGAVMRLLKRLFLTPAEGAVAPVMLADDPEYNDVTGRYYERCREKKLKPIALDPVFNEGLWRHAMKLGLGVDIK